MRLWSERQHRGLAESDAPEIHRVDLSATVLALHAWGVADPRRFGWFDPPSDARLDAAEELLKRLGGLDDSGRITAPGRQMLALPVHPRLARLLIASAHDGYLEAGAALAALLSEKEIVSFERGADRIARRERGRGTSDLLVRLDLLAEAERARFSPRLRELGLDPSAARRVAQVRDELIRIGRRIPGGRGSRGQAVETDEERMLRGIVLAYPDRVVRRRGGESTGVMVGGRGVRLAPESVVRESELFVALDPRDDRRAGTREARVRIASALRLEWLDELFPGSLRTDRSVRFDEERQRVVGVTTLSFLGLPLREDLMAPIDPEAASRALAEALRPRAPGWFQGDEAAATWLARLDLLARLMPEIDWPRLDDETLGEILGEACAGLRAVDALKKVPLVPYLRGRLTHSQNRVLEEQAPEALVVPSGSRVRLVYEPGRPPVMAVRLQELFGWTDSPRLAGGRVPVLFHLLGPNFRPVQVTDDLRSFWTTTYFQVRKDLRSRYPKHAWPEDPLTARPEAKGRRRD